LQNAAVLHRKVAIVAGTNDAPALRRIIDSAREVVTLLAVSDKAVFAGPHEYASILRIRVAEEFNAADWNLVDSGYGSRREYTGAMQQRLGQDPELACNHSEAGENQEFGELPSLDVAILPGLHGKVFLP
jgi:hypothetical protein